MRYFFLLLCILLTSPLKAYTLDGYIVAVNGRQYQVWDGNRIQVAMLPEDFPPILPDVKRGYQCHLMGEWTGSQLNVKSWYFEGGFAIPSGLPEPITPAPYYDSWYWIYTSHSVLVHIRDYSNPLKPPRCARLCVRVLFDAPFDDGGAGGSLLASWVTDGTGVAPFVGISGYPKGTTIYARCWQHQGAFYIGQIYAIEAKPAEFTPAVAPKGWSKLPGPFGELLPPSGYNIMR